MAVERHSALAQVESWVRETLDANKKRAHGWLHTDRVRRNIRALVRVEDGDPFLAELAALCHDVGRTQPGPEEEHGARSAAMAKPLLVALPLSEEETKEVLHAIRWHNSTRSDTPLLRLLRDADMLDGLGAMGLLRSFMSKSHLLPYNPDAPFEGDNHRWPPKYSSDQLFGQMEWYHRLHTATARQMAQRRVALMADFITQARLEILADGE